MISIKSDSLSEIDELTSSLVGILEEPLDLEDVDPDELDRALADARTRLGKCIGIIMGLQVKRLQPTGVGPDEPTTQDQLHSRENIQ